MEKKTAGIRNDAAVYRAPAFQVVGTINNKTRPSRPLNQDCEAILRTNGRCAERRTLEGDIELDVAYGSEKTIDGNLVGRPCNGINAEDRVVC